MRRRLARGRSAPSALALVVALLAAPGCVTFNLLQGPPAPLVETVVHGEGGPKIVLVDIDGLILDTPPDRGPLALEGVSVLATVREQLDKAASDREVRALLLRINSPGGTATASDNLYREVMRFKREHPMPVVAVLMGMATSGAYYLAMAADLVIAHPTTVTGSIGVIFAGVNLAGLMDKLGVEDQTLVAGEHKDAGSWLRRMTPEERAHLQSVLDDLHARFKQVVASGRSGLDAARIEALADGSVYSANQALANGLVDEIGDLEVGVLRARERAGIESSRVVSYHRPREYKQNLYTRPAFPQSLRLELGAMPLPRRPGFYFVWPPALGASP